MYIRPINPNLEVARCCCRLEGFCTPVTVQVSYWDFQNYQRKLILAKEQLAHQSLAGNPLQDGASRCSPAFPHLQCCKRFSHDTKQNVTILPRKSTRQIKHKIKTRERRAMERRTGVRSQPLSLPRQHDNAGLGVARPAPLLRKAARSELTLKHISR